ncbi:MAG: class I SAM-dependent methyltransferase [Burkholderiales bacterium]
MSQQIIGLHDWLATPPGRYLLNWEAAQFERAVADIFGYHALQLGLPELNALQANRMPHRWLATDALSAVGSPQPPLPISTANEAIAQPHRIALLTDLAALPFPENSLDLVLLPHTLETSADAHATLREVERVLVPEGKVVISCFNPASLWGLRQRRARLYKKLGMGDLYLPEAGEFLGYWRLRDWLRLLSFEVESGAFGCYRPAVRSEQWLNRFAYMDAVGARWWPILGSVYFVVAVKRVRGMRLMGPVWKSQKKMANAPVSVANQVQPRSGGAD